MSVLATIKGEVISVGAPFAQIKVGRQLLDIPMTDAQHKALGRHLYQEVEIVVRTPAPGDEPKQLEIGGTR